MSENHQWLLSVLADLDAYSRKNDLGELGNKIEETRKIALAEIARRAAAQAAVERSIQ
jgi:hypothetical protein